MEGRGVKRPRRRIREGKGQARLRRARLRRARRLGLAVGLVRVGHRRVLVWNSPKGLEQHKLVQWQWHKMIVLLIENIVTVFDQLQ